MAKAELEVVKISDYIGAELRGVDLRNQDEAMHAAIKQALAENGVVFLRDQDIAPEHHAQLANGLGRPQERTDPSTAIHGYPYMSAVSKAEDDHANIGNAWHIDQTYQQEPPTTTILVARELPNRGGDTLFSSTAAAYASLSEGLQAVLDSLDAVHSNDSVVAKSSRLQGRTVLPEATHPAVLCNPYTGRKSLYVTKGYTQRFAGWTAEDSAPLLAHLTAIAQRPEFQVRWNWKPGSIAIWDNSQVWHYATNDYPGRRRYMERITVRDWNIAANRAVATRNAA